MTREIYDSMRSRLSVIPTEQVKADYDAMGWTISDDAIVYRFNAEGLGEDVYSIVHCMKTKNLWNVAQRLYSHLRYQFESDDTMNQALLNN